MNPDTKVIGIIGSGQLGRMLIEYGIRKIPGYQTSLIRVYSPSHECSVATLNDPHVQLIVGSGYDDVDKLRLFANGCDVITYEIEHLNVAILERLSDDYRVPIVPDPRVLRKIQDKGEQKKHYVKYGIPTADFVLCDVLTDAKDLQEKLSNKVVIKSRLGGYDGRGVNIINVNQIPTTSTIILRENLVVEKYIDNKYEIAVIVAVHNSQVVSYKPTYMKFHATQHILDTCETPVIDETILQRCVVVARQAATSFKSAGLFAVEMFACWDGTVLVNEVAPRVHNSGHHTIHTTDVSQFEMLANILIGQMITAPIEHAQYYIMRNLYPPQQITSLSQYRPINHIGVFDPIKGPFLVDYGKTTIKAWRKMGHLTHILSSPHAIDEANPMQYLRDQAHWYQTNSIIEYVADNLPIRIGIIMGSRSDWDTMKDACSTLQDFQIGYEVTVVSAHRTPDRLVEYAKTARSRGICVIIAGAGGAAHLPGMIAANTVIPVIGVPIRTAALNGIDSLYSIVQMPPGVPVGCMAISGATNAAIYAAQIIGEYDVVEKRKREMEQMVIYSSSFQQKEECK